MRTPSFHRPAAATTSQRGIVLLEILIAILIFSIGILGVVGLQASMLRNGTEARYRVEATHVAQQRFATMWLNQDNLATYAEKDTDISTETGLPNGRRTTVRAAEDDPTCVRVDTCFRVTVTWRHPGQDETRSLTMVGHVVGGGAS